MAYLKRAFLDIQWAPVMLKKSWSEHIFCRADWHCFLGIRNLSLLKSSMYVIFFRPIREAGTNLLGYAGEPFSQGYRDASI